MITAEPPARIALYGLCPLREKTLSEVYRAGIVSTEELDTLHKDSVASFMVVDEKQAYRQATDKAYSVKDA